jgi:hypothetical protein
MGIDSSTITHHPAKLLGNLLTTSHPRAVWLYATYCLLALTLLFYMVRGPDARRRWFIIVFILTVPWMLYLGAALLDPTFLSDPIQALEQHIHPTLPPPPPPSQAEENLRYARLNTVLNLVILLTFTVETMWRWRKRVRMYRKQQQEASTSSSDGNSFLAQPQAQFHWLEILAGDFFAAAIITGVLSVVYRSQLWHGAFTYCQAALPTPWQTCTGLGGKPSDWPTWTYLESRLCLGTFVLGILAFLLAALTGGFRHIGPASTNEPAKEPIENGREPRQRSQAREVLAQPANVFMLALRALVARTQLEEEEEGFIISMVNGLRIFIVLAFIFVAVAALALAAVFNQYYIALITHDHAQAGLNQGTWWPGLFSFLLTPENLFSLGAALGLISLASVFLVCAGGVQVSIGSGNIRTWLVRIGLAGALIAEILWAGALVLALVNILLSDSWVFFPFDISAYLSFAVFIALSIILGSRGPDRALTPRLS